MYKYIKKNYVGTGTVNYLPLSSILTINSDEAFLIMPYGIHISYIIANYSLLFYKVCAEVHNNTNQLTYLVTLTMQ